MKKETKKKNSTKKDLPSMFGTTRTRGYLKNNPESEAIIDYVCDQLIEYACGTDALFVENFIREMRIPKRTFYNWVKKYPKLADTLEEAKFYIAYGRAFGVAKRHFDRGFIMHSQYRFGKEWREDDAYQAALKQTETDNEAKVFNIYSEPIPKVIDRNKHKGDKPKDTNIKESDAI